MSDNEQVAALAEAVAIEAGPLPDYCNARIERTTWAKRMLVSLAVRGWRLTRDPATPATSEGEPLCGWPLGHGRACQRPLGHEEGHNPDPTLGDRLFAPSQQRQQATSEGEPEEDPGVYDAIVRSQQGGEPVTEAGRALRDDLSRYASDYDRTIPARILDIERQASRDAEALLTAVEAWKEWRWNECPEPLRAADYELADQAAKARRALAERPTE